MGLDRKCWSNATPIRVIFCDAFAAAGLPYFNPHSVRNTLARLGEQTCTTPEEFKTWSQNMGHEKVLTTFISYGQVDRHRQQEIMRKLWEPKRPLLDEQAQAMARYITDAIRRETSRS